MKLKLEEFSTMDLTAIEKPFGLLDKATQEALKAHGGPYQQFTDLAKWADRNQYGWKPDQIIRVKPQPKVVTKRIHPQSTAWGFSFPYIPVPADRIEMLYNEVDGVIDLESIRFKEVK